ncbi:hypothetical protein [Kineococcus sp. SYSU DK005]|uniref:hypothetical protein n=1 Tax=Kineococcus sp. SYSU DK005 TaxID=3383126 RepID=UPI003D7D1514
MIARLPAATRRALLVAAVGQDAPLREVVAAARLVGSPAAELIFARCPDVLAAEEQSLRFLHSLVPSVLHDGADTGELAQVHRALAAVRRDPSRAEQHRAATSRG